MPSKIWEPSFSLVFFNMVEKVLEGAAFSEEFHPFNS
jgi:hypothetical protein